MKLKVKLFASLREAAGAELALELSDAAPGVEGDAPTVAQARAALQARGEPLASLLAPGRGVRAAVNQVLAPESQALQEGDELAFFPPVTGG